MDCLTAGAGYIRASYMERDEWAGGGGPTKDCRWCGGAYTCEGNVDGDADLVTTCTGGSMGGGRHTGMPLTIPAPLGLPYI